MADVVKDERRVDPAQLDLGFPLTNEYSIAAIPSLPTITKGAMVKYTCLYYGGTSYPQVMRDSDDWSST